jgi:hypothetical protein
MNCRFQGKPKKLRVKNKIERVQKNDFGTAVVAVKR